MAGGRPVKFNDPDEFGAIAHAYMDKTLADAAFVPTVNGLAVELGLHRDTLVEYGKKPEFSDAVKGVRARLEAWWEQRLSGPNAGGPIFWLKNQGWTDKSEVAHSGHIADSAPDELTEEEILARLAKLRGG